MRTTRWHALILLPLLPAAAEADLTMFDQAGRVSGSGAFTCRLGILASPDADSIWVRLPFPPGELGSDYLYMSQTISAFTVSADRPLCGYSEYADYGIAWYKYDVTPPDTVWITYHLDWTMEVEFGGYEVEWASADYSGTYWCEDVLPEIIQSDWDAERPLIAADADDSTQLCDDHRRMHTLCGYVQDQFDYPGPDVCRSAANAFAAIGRGWGIPIGQAIVVQAAGVAYMGGFIAVTNQPAWHGVNTYWDDDHPGWVVADIRYSANGIWPLGPIIAHEQSFTYVELDIESIPEEAGNGGVIIDYPAGETEASASWTIGFASPVRVAPCQATGTSALLATMRFATGSGRCGDFSPYSGAEEGSPLPFFEVEPNPAARLVRFLTGGENAVVRVFDVRGRLRYRGSGAFLEWRPVDSGTYFARLEDGGRSATKKLIVLR